jgi:predicted PurR-regulated permease PerM
MFKEVYNFAKSLKINITATLLAGSAVLVGPLTMYVVKSEMGKVASIQHSVDTLRKQTTAEIKSLKNHVDVSLKAVQQSQESNLKDLKETTEKQFQATNTVLSNHIIATEKDARRVQESINRLYQFSWELKKNDSTNLIPLLSTAN